jgi:hypothetical protein
MSQNIMRPFSWIWLIPAALVALATLTRGEPLIAIGIGLAAALSLSGSI